MAADRALMETILEMIPQRPPFRFIDDILSLDEKRIVGTYRFSEDEFFYQGHFPGRPVTPGVILLETMAQTGVVGYGIYQLLTDGRMTIDEIRNYTTLFSFLDQAEFMEIVYPGDRVIVRGEKIYFRRLNLKVRAVMERENGKPICSAVIAGMAVKM